MPAPELTPDRLARRDAAIERLSGPAHADEVAATAIGPPSPAEYAAARGRGVGGAGSRNTPMKFAYADPPYLGQGRKHYGEHHPEAADFDRIEAHAVLIKRLSAEFDAWALSMGPKNLRVLLPACPEDVRIGARVKPFAFFKPGVNPSYAWEPVIFRGGRKRGKGSSFMRDWVAANVRGQHAQNKSAQDGKPLSGGKPAAFCWWVFDFLGAEPDDEFHDIFPGSGAVQRAWEEWCRAHRELPLFPAGNGRIGIGCDHKS